MLFMRRHRAAEARLTRQAMADPTHSVGAPSVAQTGIVQNESNRFALQYSGQFVLGPRFVPGLPQWNQYSIGPGLFLSAHPELSVMRCTEGERSLTLLGYILSPDNPNATNTDILRGLLRAATSIQELTEKTFHLGGRWLLIARDGQERYLFNDTMGLRQAFYSDPSRFEGGVWVMSQPGLAAKCFDAKLDPSALDYRQWRLNQGGAEYMWPGSASPVCGLRHLLPNHYLDLNTARCQRFWPTRTLTPIAFDSAVNHLAQRLPQLMRAVANRFDIALGITAGIDSRLVLAASRS
ncbi:MAG: hypothetical protein JSW09_07715, partial [Pseudomonadota bacterium]